MYKQFASAVKILTRRIHPGMSLKVRPDDTFLVSYPKSGNTWMRFLIANLLQQDPPVGLLDADCLIPIVDGKSKKFFDEMKSPRIIKSHFSFIPAYKRVIYVVRDPRDVVMSQYHYQIKRGVLEKDTPLDNYVQRFIKGEVCPYGSWGENVGSWFSTRHGDPNFLLVRYEDMLADATSGAVRISSFLGLGQDPARIATAIERSSLENMRNVEKTEGAKWDSTKGTRQDMSFFRSAKSGEGRAKLSRESLDRIEKAWGPLMQSVGYTISSPTLVAAFSAAPMHP
jgi:sulfotransferase family protein